MLQQVLLAATIVACTCAENTTTESHIGQIKDILCTLSLSGTKKEDLSQDMLKKLQRHNIDIKDLNEDFVKSHCTEPIIKSKKENEKTPEDIQSKEIKLIKELLQKLKSLPESPTTDPILDQKTKSKPDITTQESTTESNAAKMLIKLVNMFKNGTVIDENKKANRNKIKECLLCDLLLRKEIITTTTTTSTTSLPTPKTMEYLINRIKSENGRLKEKIINEIVKEMKRNPVTEAIVTTSTIKEYDPSEISALINMLNLETTTEASTEIYDPVQVFGDLMQINVMEDLKNIAIDPTTEQNQERRYNQTPDLMAEFVKFMTQNKSSVKTESPVKRIEFKIKNSNYLFPVPFKDIQKMPIFSEISGFTSKPSYTTDSDKEPFRLNDFLNDRQTQINLRTENLPQTIESPSRWFKPHQAERTDSEEISRIREVLAKYRNRQRKFDQFTKPQYNIEEKSLPKKSGYSSYSEIIDNKPMLLSSKNPPHHYSDDSIEMNVQQRPSDPIDKKAKWPQNYSDSYKNFIDAQKKVNSLLEKMIKDKSKKFSDGMSPSYIRSII